VPHLSHEYQHPHRVLAPSRSCNVGRAARNAPGRADMLRLVRYLALLVLAIVFLTGLVWWLFFIGNSVVQLFRRR
jgi:hypothetical protein